jgi:uncharacterized membrane protein
MLKSIGGTMAFCSKCGSAVSDGAAFCGVCGSPASAAGAPAFTPPPPPPPMQAAPASAGMSSNIVAALAYFFITGIIFLLMDQFKKDKFVRFHSFQAVAYGVVMFVLMTVWNVFWGILSFGFFWGIISLLNTLISLALFAFGLFLMYKAYNNETFKIPVIGDWAEKQAEK